MDFKSCLKLTEDASRPDTGSMITLDEHPMPVATSTQQRMWQGEMVEESRSRGAEHTALGLCHLPPETQRWQAVRSEQYDSYSTQERSPIVREMQRVLSRRRDRLEHYEPEDDVWSVDDEYNHAL